LIGSRLRFCLRSICCPRIDTQKPISSLVLGIATPMTAQSPLDLCPGSATWPRCVYTVLPPSPAIPVVLLTLLIPRDGVRSCQIPQFLTQILTIGIVKFGELLS
jgi:hypothetical protein